MINLEIDPQTTITVPRPMPDQVVVLTCDTNGARCWMTMSKTVFNETTGLLPVLEEGTSRLYQQGDGAPSPDWVLSPGTLAARGDVTARFLSS